MRRLLPRAHTLVAKAAKIAIHSKYFVDGNEYDT
jgi:hypothetical protein